MVQDEAALLQQAGHDVQSWTPTPSTSKGLKLIQTGGRAIWSRNAAATVDAAIERFNPDVVHCHNLFPELSPVVFRVAEHRRIPAIVTLHNYRYLCLPATFLRDGRVCEDCLGRIPWRGVVHRCYRDSILGSSGLATSLTLHRMVNSFKKVSLFLAVSRFVAEKHIEGGFPANKFRIKPNFSWPLPRRTGAGEYFLYLGRLSGEKGIDTLLKAWRAIAANLIIVGSGPQYDELRSLAPKNVDFYGDVEPEAIAPLLKNARALVLPSIWYEAAPRVIVEAYAAGVPVIASRIGALVEAVEDGTSGLLVNAGDASSLVEGIERLLDNDESKHLGEGAYEAWRKTYAPDRATVMLETAYQDALRRA